MQEYPHRVYNNEVYLALKHAREYWVDNYWYVGKTSFTGMIKRLNVPKWEMPAGSKLKYIKRSDLDRAATPVPAK
jgi:hypothetical protein